jgi:hypothetical protein
MTTTPVPRYGSTVARVGRWYTQQALLIDSYLAQRHPSPSQRYTGRLICPVTSLLRGLTSRRDVYSAQPLALRATEGRRHVLYRPVQGTPLPTASARTLPTYLQLKLPA